MIPLGQDHGMKILPFAFVAFLTDCNLRMIFTRIGWLSYDKFLRRKSIRRHNASSIGLAAFSLLARAERYGAQVARIFHRSYSEMFLQKEGSVSHLLTTECDAYDMSFIFFFEYGTIQSPFHPSGPCLCTPKSFP